MKFKAVRGDLLQALSKVREAVSSKDLVPIQKCLYVKVDDDETITLRAYNSELMAETVFYAKVVEQPGECCIPAKQFIGMIQLLPEGEIDFVQMKTQIVVQSGSIVSKIRIQDSDMFPKFPAYQIQADFDSEFIAWLKKVKISMVKDAVRTNMRGVYLDSRNGYRRMTATNNIVINSCVVEIQGNKFDNLLLPDSFVEEIVRQNPHDFGFFLTDSVLGAEFEIDGTLTKIAHTRFAVPAIDFEPIFKKIPSTTVLSALIDVETLKAVCERALFVIPGVTSKSVRSEKAIKVAFDIQGKGKVNSKSDEMQLEEVFSFEGEIAKKIVVELGPDYLLDFLGSVDEAKCSFDILGPDLPIRLATTAAHTYLIVPYTLSISAE